MKKQALSDVKQRLRRLGKMFGDNVLAAAIWIDCTVTNHAPNIKGESYQLKEKRKVGALTKSATPISER
ncbi:hypothetical protein KCP74_25135 [Salmonella enterica subsp. enterica]|nr:hypothetical protein KCP74_25135 [Salmonella enterica subsp. enterica]